MRVFFLRPFEDWIVDRFAEEFRSASRHEVVFDDPQSCDVVWLAADWCSDRLSLSLLREKPVLCTIHHKVPEKWNEDIQKKFIERDALIDLYHVPCNATMKWPLSLVNNSQMRVKKIGYWYDVQRWYQRSRSLSRLTTGVPKDSFVIGSFQRDTEGHDLISPKLEKGPDIFCDVVEKLAKKRENVFVLLNSFRRGYVVSRLTQAKINFKQIDAQKNLSWAYGACDLYVVGSRYEGGPMALLECSAQCVPIVSTNVGMAHDILPSSCIKDLLHEPDLSDWLPSEQDVDTAFKNVQRFELKRIVVDYDDLLEQCYNRKRNL